MTSMTAAGTTIAISAALPPFQSAAGYASLSFIEIGQVEKVGALGSTFAKAEFQPLKGPKQKYKASNDNGTLTPVIALDASDAGQALLWTASEDATQKLYSFRVFLPDGAVRYFLGRVLGMPETADGPDTMLTGTPTIEIVSKVVKVAANAAPDPTDSPGPALTISSADAQTFMGGFSEVQVDSFGGGAQGSTSSPATDGATDVWGMPYSLTASEKSRFRDALFPANGTMLRFIRFPLGFAYRGLRNVDGTSGLARNIGERYAGQNQSVVDLIAPVVSSGGGLWPEYWSPAPHWKTTGAYGNGRLTAGGSYSRATSLESIRTTDVTQFNAQVDAFTTAIVNDLEYLHQNVGPVRGFALQNEGITTFGENYGTCNYSAAEYRAVLEAVIPKIRGSAILSTWGGQANTVLIHADSWQGMTATAAMWDNTTALSTGKTALQELWAQAIHRIEEISAAPEWIRTNGATLNSAARGKPTIISEFEFFHPEDYSDAQRFARIALKMVHEINLLRAPAVMPIIHVAKQLGQTGSASNTLGYALTKVRLPAPFGAAPGSAGDTDPAIGYGQFDFVTPNWNAARFLLNNLPPGAVIRPINLTNAPNSMGAVAALVAGRLYVFTVNLSSQARYLPITLPSSMTMAGKRYTATAAGEAIGADQTGTELLCTMQPYSAEVWVQQGAVTPPVLQPAYTTWSGPGWFDASDAATVGLTSGTQQVASLANKRSGGGDLTRGGTAANLTRVAAAQNNRDVVRVVRDASATNAPPRLSAADNAPVSTVFQGEDKAATIIVAFKPTDTNTGFIWSASRTADATNAEVISFVRREASASGVRRSNNAQANRDVNFGAGDAAGTPMVVAVRFEGQTVSIWKNGTKVVASAAQDAAAFNAVGFRLFAAAAPSSNGQTIGANSASLDFYEIVVSDVAQSDADIAQAIADIRSKWSI